MARASRSPWSAAEPQYAALRVLVTGAAGFVGRTVVARLRDSVQVTGVDAVAAPGVDVHGDLADSATLSRCFAQPVDAVLHLATWPGGAAEREPGRAWHVNMDAARLLVDAAAAQGHRPRFIFSSSIAVYGDPLPERIDDATPLAPTLLYGAHKAMMEIWLDNQTRRGAINALSLRLPGVVARPRASTALRSAFLSDLFHALAADEPITLPVSPDATTALQSVQCIAQNLVHALQCNATGAMNLPAQVMRIGDLVDAVARATGSSASRVSWDPDPVIEAQFGRVPPLHAPRAMAAGFRADEGLEGLVAAALAGLTFSR